MSQMPTPSPRPANGMAHAAVVTADRLIHALARHWLALFNLVAGLYAGLPVLAPLLDAGAAPQVGAFLFRLYGAACHQKPERSFFLLGHQMAFCQRDLALYGAILVAGLAFALSGRRARPLALRWFLLCLAPMAIDGGGQLLGFWESTWWLRVLTGVPAGASSVAFAYPYLERAFTQVRSAIEANFSRAGLSLSVRARTTKASRGE
jgi:uncharacterized membrane protein